MDNHQLGDMVISSTPSGATMVGIITKISVSTFDVYSNLYGVMWFGEEQLELYNCYYTHYNVTKLKENLKKIFESDST